MGIKTLILTNAAGGLNPDLRAGDLMLITDHINLPGLAGLSPLMGGGFLDLRQAYDPDLGNRALRAAAQLGLTLRPGVYAMVVGPSYETPAEARLLQALGADAVGMSTVPEVLAARQAGLRVLALSLITNPALASAEPLSHQMVLAQAEAAAPKTRALLEAIIGSLES
jgi:purine-nucleoside phosphorylase